MNYPIVYEGDLVHMHAPLHDQHMIDRIVETYRKKGVEVFFTSACNLVTPTVIAVIRTIDPLDR